MLRRLRNFFFPPPEASAWKRYSRLGLLGAIPLAILLAIPPAWEYSNSPGFCGETCHTMPPEYNTYLVSPHARVKCVDCHIGRDSLAVQVYRKSFHMHLLFDTITGNYEYPIRVSSMRPARETCELCHFPEKFSDDSLRQINRFQDDEQNDPYIIYLLMHTGGGSAREGLGRGIHWHVENKVEYIALDKEEQIIPWVRVNNPDGSVIEYTTLDPTFDPSTIDEYDKHDIDCITCHNRISHQIQHPRDLVDNALARNDLPQDLPFIRSNAVDVLGQPYDSTSDAKEAITTTLASYYSENYPDTSSDEVQQAIAVIEQLWDGNNYPEQELNWDTHPNNVGHRDSAGCFRCHDGKHFTEQGDAIRLECNLCHSIPQIVKPGEIEPSMPLTTGLEPASHLETTWISQHHVSFDSSCSNCHTTANPGGTTDTSFCSNSGCHGVNWQYAGFNAPELAVALGLNPQTTVEEPTTQPLSGEPLTYQTLQPMFEATCGMCHGETPSKGLRLITYEGIMAGGEDGPIITPGDPDTSLIIQILEAGHFAQLTDDQMALLKQWIAEGAIEGAPTPAEEATPAPTEEVEPTATEETVPDATEEATPAPTEEVEPAATEEATPAATEEATAAPTEEATAEPVPNVTPYWATVQ